MEGATADRNIQMISGCLNKGELYGTPFSMNDGIMAYNKDIFDNFGVAGSIRRRII
jgi:ABC-type glycerol-3-phosphate transport system substrate-binding protein